MTPMRPGGEARAPETFLPLRPVELQVLLSLGEGERHGYGMIQDAEARSGGEVIPELGTLYRALRRMLEADLIEEADRRPSHESEDERRKYYRITPLGRRVATAEAERLSALVRAARASGFLEADAV